MSTNSSARGTPKASPNRGHSTYDPASNEDSLKTNSPSQGQDTTEVDQGLGSEWSWSSTAYKARLRRLKHMHKRRHRKGTKYYIGYKGQGFESSATTGSDEELLNTTPNAASVGELVNSPLQPLALAGTETGGMSRTIEERAEEICGAGKNRNKFHEWTPRFPKSYGYPCLFRYATMVDCIFMLVGLVAAVVSGACLPAAIVAFGHFLKIKVLIEKMNCNPNRQSCLEFLRSCNIDNFSDKRFLEKPLNDRLLTEEYMSTFLWTGLVIVFVYTVNSSLYYFCWSFTSHRQGVKLRSAYFNALLKKEKAWFDTQQDPEAINRAMENTRLIVETIGETFPMSVNILVMCCFSIAIAGWISLALTGLCLVTLPFYLIACWLVYHFRAMRILKERRAYRIAHDMAIDVLSKMRTVIGYANQARELAFYSREIERGNCYVIKAIVLNSLAVGLLYTMCYGIVAIVFWYGEALLVLPHSSNVCTDTFSDDYVDASEFAIVVMNVVFLGCNVEMVFSVLVTARVARLCCVDVFQLIDSTSNAQQTMKLLRPPGPMSGRVEFDDVRFSYPGTGQKLVLNRLSFVVEPNTTIALVGLSEHGKSTVLKLISKEYLANSGFIKIDGIDIRALDSQWLRAHIGVIPQDLRLFDETIEENVRMGKLRAGFDEIMNACIAVGAHEFIINFKNGYQTNVGHQGNRLTPCQQQLILMARAIIRDPRILLLDEPTQDLDSQSLRSFMKCLKRVSRGRTVIIVAHRLSTIIHANRIYVMKNGRVTESGTHKDLIQNDGPYSQLCKTNRGSNSFHRPRRLDAFDTSEMTIVSCWKTFYEIPALPSLYISTLAVDPVFTRVIRNIMINQHDTERGYHIRLDWNLTISKDCPATADSDTHEILSLNSELIGDKPSGNENNNGDYGSQSKVALQVYEDPKPPILPNIIPKGKHAVETRKRTLTMASTSPILITGGVLFSVLMSAGIPAFSCSFALIIDVLSDVEGKPLHWSTGWQKGLFSTLGLTYCTQIAIHMGILAGLCGICGFLHNLLLNIAGYRAVKTLRKFMYSCILNQDMSFFEDPKNTPVTLASILFQDTDAIRHITYGVYGTLIQCICMLLLAIILSIVVAPKLAGYSIISIVIVVGFSMIDAWLAKKQHGRAVTFLQQRSLLILKVFQWKHVITVCQLESHYQNQFTILEMRASKSNKRIRCIRIATFGLAQSAILWGFGLFLLMGKESVYDRELFFNMLIVLFLITFGLITVGTNFSVTMGFNHVSKGGQRMMEILNRKPSMQMNDALQLDKYDCSREVEFINTYFWKPPTPDTPLLKGINVGIAPNRLTAIVGYSDSGKNAFLELLGRYYNANNGLVTVGGNDLQYFEADSLREHLSVVLREPELFNRTVAQNIAIGAMNRSPSMCEVIEAAKEADVHNLIVSLPEGYETRVSGENDYLSTAHKQKICIARALMKRPKLIIFDEITSNMDREGETAVLECIREVMKDRTVVMISQRLHPVMLADWIIVMEKGYLEEQGRHQELLKRRPHGVYATMWRAQNPMEDEFFIKGNIPRRDRVSFAVQETGRYKHATLVEPEYLRNQSEDDEDKAELTASWCLCS